MPDDAAQTILTPVQADDSVKAQAWQAFNDSKDENDFAQKIGSLNLPQEAKASLWEAKKSGGTGVRQTSGATPGASQITGISAATAPSGWREKTERWAQNVADDIKYGTDVTGIGSLLHKMGAHGVYNGNSQDVADFIAGLPLGALRAAKGAAEITEPGKAWEGTKDIAGGTAQALTIPSAFMGGPAAEAGGEAAANVAGKVFGDAEKAGNLFDKVAAAAKDVDVPVTDEMYGAIADAKKLADAGAKGLPRVITKFFNRVSNVDEPLTWDEARRFYSNVSRLSANEYQTMAPQMSRAVAKFGSAFADALEGVAEEAGVADDYSQAMQLYSKAKSWQKLGSNVWNVLKSKAGDVAAGAVGGGAATYGILRALHGGNK